MGYFDTPKGRMDNEPNEMVDMPSPTRGLPGYSSGLQRRPDILGAPMPNPQMKRGIMGTVQPQKQRYTPKQYGQQVQAQKNLRSGYPTGGVDAIPQMAPAGRQGPPSRRPMPQGPRGPEQGGMGQQWLGQLWSGSLGGGSGFAGGGPIPGPMGPGMPAGAGSSGSNLARMYQEAKARFSQGLGDRGAQGNSYQGGGPVPPMIEGPSPGLPGLPGPPGVPTGGPPSLPVSRAGAPGGNVNLPPFPGDRPRPSSENLREELSIQKYANQLLMEELERCMGGGGIPTAIVPKAQLALANGGFVSPMQNASSQIALQGRGGDDVLVHMNRHELSGLESLLGPTTVNPTTGNPEAFVWLPILAGIAIGAAVGGATSQSWEGALIGGALGGLGGAVAPVAGALAGPAAGAAAGPAAGAVTGAIPGAGGGAIGALPASGAGPALAGLGGTSMGSIAPTAATSSLTGAYGAATGAASGIVPSGVGVPAASGLASITPSLMGKSAMLGLMGAGAGGTGGGGGAEKRGPMKAAPGSWIDRPGSSRGRGGRGIAGRGLTRPDYIG